jgi:hypothetical protein
MFQEHNVHMTIKLFGTMLNVATGTDGDCVHKATGQVMFRIFIIEYFAFLSSAKQAQIKLQKLKIFLMSPVGVKLGSLE